MDKLRVVHVAPPFLALNENMKYGGIERVIMSLVKKQRLLDLDLGIIAPMSSNIKEVISTVLPIGVDEIYSTSISKDTVRSNSLKKLSHVEQVLSYAKTNPHDVLHFHDDYFAPFMHLFNNPVLMTLHSPYEEFWMTESNPGIEKKVKNLIAISKKQYNLYESHGYAIRDVIYNGIDVEDFPYQDKKSDFLLSLSAIAPHKGQKIAIELAEDTKQSIIIAGNIANQEYFDEMIKPCLDFDISDHEDKLAAYNSLPQSSKIVYAGPVNDEQKKPLFANAKCFLMPIVWEEPFGLVAVEALACGTPVFAFSRGALPELVKDGVTGVLASDYRHLRDALNYNIGKFDPLDCRVSVIDNFSSHAMAIDYKLLYDDLVLGI